MRDGDPLQMQDYFAHILVVIKRIEVEVRHARR